MKNAALSVNALGLGLYRSFARPGNRLISPISVQAALAMAFAGASGATREEMLRVLRFSEDVHASFAALREALATAVGEGGALDLANRVFVKEGFALRDSFLATVALRYGAEPEALDFAHADDAAAHINDWVARATHDKIRSLVSPALFDEKTRLVLANALYLRAAWAEPFHATSTRDEEFFANGKDVVRVPTMMGMLPCGYEEREADGFELVSLPFESGALRLLVILPTERGGLDGVERRIDAALLADAAHLQPIGAVVRLPKFRLEPEALALKEPLGALGLETVFDRPEGSANFDGIAPRRTDDYLYVSEVMHKTFLAIDERGVEAAAVTALMMPQGASAPSKPPPIIRIDRPFFFAVQHAASGTCLFVGRVDDPRVTTCAGTR